jgi:hypothetical protein
METLLWAGIVVAQLHLLIDSTAVFQVTLRVVQYWAGAIQQRKDDYYEWVKMVHALEGIIHDQKAPRMIRGVVLVDRMPDMVVERTVVKAVAVAALLGIVPIYNFPEVLAVRAVMQQGQVTYPD